MARDEFYQVAHKEIDFQFIIRLNMEMHQIWCIFIISVDVAACPRSRLTAFASIFKRYVLKLTRNRF